MSLASPRGHSPINSPDRSRRRSRSIRRSRSPREDSHPRSVTKSPLATRESERHGHRTRSKTRSFSRGRSRSPSRSRGGRRYRSTSYSRSPSPHKNLPRSAKIVVEKLTRNVTENHLREIFGSFGDIEYLDLPMNRACKRLLSPKFGYHRSPIHASICLN
ncbi:Serine/arginine-rich splicing factor SR45 [Penicillium macrosclerotiorum]|uniref:Serine/arginine-rich splicing factor SR45 n=1 Tax=Penicillium macrosclerotiorum TaxID=303699 RepID=UPI0025489E04|nr:Serine/arginine-rich splicing factor SR45 [Penicillium macrosclerotiorum]KAJ5683181.1 Serine/arginine-rich splicing factor SR45 [Penicillium macrosclerotiorum]